MTTNKKSVRLPRKLSSLLTLALDDLENVEKSKRYTVDMSAWHDPNWTEDGDRCFVCLAGAVMAKSLGVDINTHAFPGDFSPAKSSALHALNNLRNGRVTIAAIYIGYEGKKLHSCRDFNRRIPEYSQDCDGFHRELRKLAADLKGAGL